MVDMFEKVVVTVFSFVVATLLFLVIFAASMIVFDMTGIPCANKAKLLNVEHSHSISTGCWVKIHDRFVPLSEIIPVEKDGKIGFTPKTPLRIEMNTK